MGDDSSQSGRRPRASSSASTDTQVATTQPPSDSFDLPSDFSVPENTETRRRILIDRASYFELAPDLFAIASLLGSLQQVNPAWTRVLGWRAAEVAGRNLGEFVHPDDRERLRPYGETLAAGERVDDVELRLRDRNGRYRIIVCSAVSDGGLVYGVGRDVTEQRQERERLDRMKDEFLSTVSHELRTPLTSIRGALGLLDAGVVESAQKRAELVRIAAANCDRLVRLVNDMLDMQNIESGLIHFDFSLCDVAQVVRRTVELNESYGALHNVRFVYAPPQMPVIAEVDTGRIEQVVTNLLSNAAKFSAAESEVMVRVERAGARVRVSVTDVGPGIPLEFRHRVFQRFAQAESMDSRRFDGSGLGLHISRLIVERHRGDIGFDSEVGVGTRFWFDLPIAPSRRIHRSTEDAPRFTPVATRAVGARPRILHVEDDSDLGQIVAECLGDEFDVVTMRSARDARRYFRTHAIDLMILDVRLPDSDGMRLVPRLRNVQPSTPVVVFSGDTCPPGGVAGVEVWLEKTRASEVELAAIVRTLVAAHGPPA